MSGLIDDAWRWWQGGDVLMPVMLLVALVLYAILAERSLVLWGVRRGARTDDILAALRHGHAGERDERWRAWAARYVGIAEAEQLARGFALCRALTAALPLLGLLGTVTGMIDTFAHIGVGAGGGASAAQQSSAGIGLALTATQYGMALAIPAVIWDWILSRRVAQLAHHRELVVRAAQDPRQQRGPEGGA
ncbi:MAG TPA: MotA/TolQ/ExbB proton channel family protein [Planctomycetota bacterium]|nr:MotA/TolQ/ExbB proton channel family protein [Planctomycetota bacterium]